MRHVSAEPARSPVRPLLVATLQGVPGARPPVWLMRQAGRYLPEYRALRQKVPSFLELCRTPELAIEITLQPVRRFGLDAAILFSDILVVPDALGCAVRFEEGAGPRLTPVRTRRQLRRLERDGLRERLAAVYAAVRGVREALPAATALIGFAGAPWTVAAYMVEGEGSKEFGHARALARRDPELFAELIELLTDATTAHLLAQIEAGAQAVQLFDSWAGVLPEPEFARWCRDPAARIVGSLKQARPDVPVIAFPRGAGALYPAYQVAVAADGLGLDTAVPLGWARRALPEVCLQGNLDPVALLVGGPAMLAEAERIVAALAGSPFVFNLGHGVLPETDPDSVAALVDFVKSLGPENG
ncbi:MAG TPA: uroporphyrinogen decarboxylase [Geminicoccaceae bacterium]|nr:uroporphyrinogen decarboxylase [Geminicoccaceae bacterium]